MVVGIGGSVPASCAIAKWAICLLNLLILAEAGVPRAFDEKTSLNGCNYWSEGLEDEVI